MLKKFKVAVLLLTFSLFLIFFTITNSLAETPAQLTGKILLMIGDNNGSDLYTTENFKDFKQITHCADENMKCNSGKFSPNGKKVIYRKYSNSTWPNAEIWIADLEKNENKLVKKLQNISFLEWLDNDSEFLYNYNNNSSFAPLKDKDLQIIFNNIN